MNKTVKITMLTILLSMSARCGTVESSHRPNHIDGGLPAADAQESQDAEISASFPRLIHTPQQIEHIKAALSETLPQQALQNLLTEAEAALSLTPDVPENYVVPGYYLNKDGHRAAKKVLMESGEGSYALALAYQLTERADRDRYAQKAVEILDLWATKNKKVSSTLTDADGPLTMMYKGVFLLLAADLLMEYAGWPSENKATFNNWVSTVFRPTADSIKGRPTNWGAWGTFGSIAGASLLDDAAGIAADVARIKKFFTESIDKNGELPEENKRTNSGIWYTYFSLSPLSGAMTVAQNATGENLFTYQTSDGRSLKLALDKLFTYCLDPQSWPYPKNPNDFVHNLLYPSADTLQIPTPEDWPGNLYEVMSAIYHVTAWEDWIRNNRPLRGSDFWLHPTLLRPGL